MAEDITTYSAKIPGVRGNYGWPIRFDLSNDGFLGITQFDGEAVKDRILLSPRQVKELLTFVNKT